MPKGKKTCEKCGAENGPRCYNCIKCGHGFVIKGVRQPNIVIGEVKPKKKKKKSAKAAETSQLWELVSEYDGQDEARLRRKHDITGKTWQSNCGKYRIREQLTYMGVDMQANFGCCVHLLKLVNGSWEHISQKHSRFKDATAALRAMALDMKGVLVEKKEKRRRGGIKAKAS